MKLSYSTLATPDLSGVEAIRLARIHEFDGIDLRVSEMSGELTLDASKEQLRELSDTLNGEGIALASLWAYNEYGGSGPASWNQMEMSLLRHIELANKLGATSMRIGLGKKPKDQSEALIYLARLTEVIQKVLGQTSNQLTLLIQNHYNNLNIQECAKIIQHCGTSKLGLIVSSDHCWLQGEDPQTVGLAATGITKQFYVADIQIHENGYEDVLPGMGEIPMHAYVSTLGGHDFQGWVTFKWEKLWRPYLADPEVALPAFISYMRNLMNE
ncbi:sugar phosphate isomerase/epimerase family protein [Paenibacillus qinlingensis]|uniref:sugar phosphate isomerase/epimerase family protein n=1 Tax=Paenibacillus qinlingensis TaxID=1837343 RepID=UPI001563CDE5|nr:TIM barrel protein [Paenibacillus qinlingensis]NQX58656.1 TIM barrel protein [Paenibacillus qinlingensis]